MYIIYRHTYIYIYVHTIVNSVLCDVLSIEIKLALLRARSRIHLAALRAHGVENVHRFIHLHWNPYKRVVKSAQKDKVEVPPSP